MSTLLGCPFCGGNDLVIQPVFAEDEPDFEIAKAVHCRDCCAIGRHSNRIGWAESDREAIEAWNTRHIPEGYALVPVEPSKELAWKMTLAAAGTLGFSEDSETSEADQTAAQGMVSAMIAAAQGNPSNKAGQ